MRRSSNPSSIRTFRLDIPVGGTGAQVVSVFQVMGSVRILEQVAEITEVTTLTNLTNMYATLWDGTVSVNLTADGAVLSGAPVGTIFTKDQVAAQTYSVSLADQCRLSEVASDKWFGLPFTVTQKTATDTFIRFHYTTTDNPVDFRMYLKFSYESLDGGSLVQL